MAVYVDDMEAPFGRMIMCHMIADTDAELVAMAETIGVAKKWHQYPGTARSHFDIAKSMKAKAVAAGAKEITWRQTGMVSRYRRQCAMMRVEPTKSIEEILATSDRPEPGSEASSP